MSPITSASFVLYSACPPDLPTSDLLPLILAHIHSTEAQERSGSSTHQLPACQHGLTCHRTHRDFTYQCRLRTAPQSCSSSQFPPRQPFLSLTAIRDCLHCALAARLLVCRLNATGPPLLTAELLPFLAAALLTFPSPLLRCVTSITFLLSRIPRQSHDTVLVGTCFKAPHRLRLLIRRPSFTFRSLVSAAKNITAYHTTSPSSRLLLPITVSLPRDPPLLVLALLQCGAA